MLFHVWAVTILLSFVTAADPRWWKLYHLANDPEQLKSPPSYWYHILERKQRNMARRQKNLLGVFSTALKEASVECQRLFQNHKWNCTPGDSVVEPVFGSITEKACRETAFLYGLVSASAVRAVAKACSAGLLHHCSCDPEMRGPTPAGWEWRGCSDNLPYALRLTRRFIDSTEKGRDIRSIMNSHNSEAGRAHAKATTVTNCVCFGLFGSCTQKQCTREAGDIEKISNRLYRRFNKAAKLGHVNENSPPVSRKRRALPGTQKKDLVYLEESPDLCHRQDASKGRECNATDPNAADFCPDFCCNGYFLRRETRVNHRCSCTFTFCCTVTCRSCNYTHIAHYCT